MKSQKKAILRLLEQHGDSLSVKQIRGALGLIKATTPKLKAELLKLVNRGKIVKKGTRYAKIEKGELRIGNVKTRIKQEKPRKKSSQLSGYFTRNPKGFGFVAVGGGLPDVFIGEREQGQAMEGDLVEIELLGKRGFRGKQKGQIVRILKRATHEILARLKRSNRETLALPVHRNSGIPFIWIAPDSESEHEFSGLKSGVLVEVELLEERKRPKKRAVFDVPVGRILRALENTSDHELGFQLILKENLIRTEFPQEVLEYPEGFSKQVRFDSASGRKDLRHLDFVTIDGKNARDFDDAVCVLPEQNGNFRLYVAIADVAHYVRPGDPVDTEARLRGTSVYFPTHAVPMLPETLSNNLCSLRPNVNRLTLTCEMQINAEGEVLDYALSESIIRSRARLIYDDVAGFLDSKSPIIGNGTSVKNPERQKQLRTMYKLANILERKRLQRGAVQFSFAEEVFEFDAEQQMTGIARTYQSSAMKLIEQFMLEANETVARHCLKNKLPALYRVHDSPDMRKLQKLQQTFFRFGVRTALSKLNEPKEFNTIFEQIQELPNCKGNFEQLQILLLRTMALAVYQTENKGHFGLAAEHYAHFTSPIRRYPDLVVHRAIKEKIHSDKNRQKQTKTKQIKDFDNSVRSLRKKQEVDEELAGNCSQQERRAEKAERQSVDLMKVDFLAPHAGQSFQAVVVSVDKKGFRVNLEAHGIEWFLPLESLYDDWYVYDAVRLSLQGRRKNRTFQAGQRLQIRLLRADTVHRTLEFEVEQWLN